MLNKCILSNIIGQIDLKHDTKVLFLERTVYFLLLKKKTQMELEHFGEGELLLTATILDAGKMKKQ